MFYKENNVFEEAVERIKMLFDTHEDIIVCMSGGKDSTVVFEIALMVAREKNRLPLKVFWLDQEAEWQGTVDYMNEVMHMPEVEPYWYQIPFDFPNNLSQNKKVLKVWDDDKKDKWIHPLSDIGIHKTSLNVDKYNRDDAFYYLVRYLPTEITKKNCAVLVGMRMDESPTRRIAIVGGAGKWHGITWCTTPIENTRKFWPIYDFKDADVWTAIAKNKWKYNRVYDLMYQSGIPRRNMRVSALIHETAWTSMESLQEFEPKTYNKFVARISGASTFGHVLEDEDLVPKKLPIAFASWKEYRDYLLDKICPVEDRETYIKRWKKQNDDEWYRIHVKELILNDTCGTINKNHYYQEASKERLKKYRKRHSEQFEEYMKRQEA